MGVRQVKAADPSFAEGTSGTRESHPDPVLQAALAAEQPAVSRMYARLDDERVRAGAALREAPAAGGGSAFQAQMERTVATEEAARRLGSLNEVERGLVFGRIDHRAAGTDDVGRLYIGRIGLRNENGDPLLIDWRAPMARPFYTATPSDPGDLARRRHLHLRNRELVRIDDEVFDLDALGDEDRSSIVGEAALLATLRRGRTGRMTDVVATIQREQDDVIRSGLHGVLVVQGGPGTGKTVAALHRAAFLLYNYRDVLERRGVLVVGPNATFMRYIEQVLPGLGETDVAMVTPGQLYPGLHATATESDEAAIVKGDLRMPYLIAAAVQERQRAPREGLQVTFDEITLNVDGEALVRARDRARSIRAPHNVQRRQFVHYVLEGLATNRAEQFNSIMDEPLEQMAADGEMPEWLSELMDEEDDEQPLLDETDMRLAKEDLWADPGVKEAIDELWPELTPRRLLSELFADPDALAVAAAEAGLSDAERDTLLRPQDAPWTVSDVPLLDEAAEWLGVEAAVDSAERARQRTEDAERAVEERYAREVLASVENAEMVDAAELAERYRDDGPVRTTAERALADREWAYGHVIVDEAQELSAMAWRSVMRRVPTRSMTVVGDIAQTGNAAGARSWGQMLDRYVPGRWREQRLMVNYRTPAAIMKLAATVLAEVAPEEIPPESVRDDGAPPDAERIPAAEYPSRLPQLLRKTFAEIDTGRPGEGRLAVITSRAQRGDVVAALAEPDPAHPRGVPYGPAIGATPEALDSPVVVLTTEESKGLEFDAVVVVDPAGILGESPRGGHDLYVAITRATRRLTVVHGGDLPPVLAELDG
ncbi:AAA family ATPase [Actinoallomurus acanthiterrae]